MEKQIARKVKTLRELGRISESLKGKGKRVVLSHGVFDLVHLGHIRHFNLAKRQGDVLMVTLTADSHVKRGPGRPVFSENLRAETLASLSVTDYVGIVHAPTAIEAIREIKPDVYVKGGEYREKEKDVTGMICEEENAVNAAGGRLGFTDDITFSSSSLLNSYLDVFPRDTSKYLQKFSKKHPVDAIVAKLNSLKELKVLIIGDAIIDQYHYVMPMGKSSKEHLVVNRYEGEESFAGGAIATANNIANLCGKVDILTVLGKKNSCADFIREHLSPNVKPMFFFRGDSETIIKRRFVHRETNAKLFELCYINDDDIPAGLESKISQKLSRVLGDYDLVVVNDFGHGMLTGKLIKIITRKSKYLSLNVQTNSANTGFNLVTKYPRADLICIDKMELRLAARDKNSDLRTLAKKIRKELDCGQIIVTRGPHGSLSYNGSHGFCETPAFSYRVVDAIGAGDAFFAYVSPCFAAGLPQELVSFIGNAVGSLAVQIICNREPVALPALLKFITRLLK